MTRPLLVVDRYDAVAPGHAGTQDEPHDVLLLGLSAEWFRWQHAERAALPPGWSVIDPAPLVSAATARVRDFVVSFIAALPSFDAGHGTLAALLDDPEGNAWWHLETSEKGPYRGPLIQQLYLLALAREAASGRPAVTFSVSDPLLAAAFRGDTTWRERAAPAAPAPRMGQRPAVRYWMHALAAAVRLAAAKLLVPPLPPIAPGGRLIFTAYPAWWNGLGTAHPTERFFAAVGETVADGYLVLVTSPAPLWSGGAALRRRLRDRRMAMLPRFARWRDLFALLHPKRFARLRAFERRFRARITAPFAGFDAGPLVARDISRALSGGETFQDLLLRRTVARAADQLRPREVLYRAEFQPAENAVLRGLQPRARGVGFVHFPFGENYLPMRFAPGEVSGWLARRDDPRARPMPDGVVANGARIAAHVSATGYPPGRVALCGPVRYAPLMTARRAPDNRDTLRARLSLPTGATIVFVALAIVPADTEALFGALVGARDTDALFLVRTHPNRPKGDLALERTLAALGAKARLIPAGAAVYDYLAASDAMVCIGSMIAFEAMALGVMPIVFENPSTYCAVSLTEYEDGLFIARSAGELSAALDSAVRHGPDAARKRQAWPTLLLEVMGDLDRDPAAQLREALETLAPA